MSHFNISTVGINVSLEDIGVTLNHPETLDLYSEGLGSSDIIDSIDLQNALDSGILIATDGEGNKIEIINIGDLSSQISKNKENISSLSSSLSWNYLVSNWSIVPSFITNITEGSVYNYELEGVVRYRVVPLIYNPILDCFYENFDGSVLTNLIVSRG